MKIETHKSEAQKTPTVTAKKLYYGKYFGLNKR